jgi:hypothetical protein
MAREHATRPHPRQAVQNQAKTRKTAPRKRLLRERLGGDVVHCIIPQRYNHLLIADNNKLNKPGGYALQQGWLCLSACIKPEARAVLSWPTEYNVR